MILHHDIDKVILVGGCGTLRTAVRGVSTNVFILEDNPTLFNLTVQHYFFKTSFRLNSCGISIIRSFRRRC